MEQPSVTHSTFVIERSYPSTPEQVFSAFADPAKKRRWYAENKGTDLESFEMDFRVGGRDRTQSRFKEGSPFPGTALIAEVIYQDIVPNRRIVIAYTMALGDRRFSASQGTFELLPTDNGTNLIFTEQGAFFEAADGPQMREQGWRALLDHLAEELARESAVHAQR
jgi:uncharacterized protein YndB with AHSA1/START domain